MIELRQRPRSPRHERTLQDAGVHPLLARLYASRGIQTRPPQHAADLLAPSGLLDIDTAAHRLLDALCTNERIVIVADYDCDGATACAIGLRGLRRMGATVTFVVPNRLTHGYGLTPDVVDLARAHHPTLIVTVDNGIASVEGVAHARALGIDVIVTDHHLPGDTRPAACAIVNPNQTGCTFASKALAGVGVMFYVLLAVRAAGRARGLWTLQQQPRLDDLLDLVALGTVADLVPLDANNRLLVRLGLDRMRAGGLNAGLRALTSIAGREWRRLCTEDLGFALGPRINAAGRLEDMRLGIECLSTDDPARATFLAEQLDRINAERKHLQQDMNALAQDLTAVPDDDMHGSCVLVASQAFHPGVTGLVASRLRERQHRPALVFAPAEGGRWTGSGRSIPGFHLRDAIDLVTKRHPDAIERFGGHAMAAGLTVRAGCLDAVMSTFRHIANDALTPELLQRTLEVDGSLEAHYLTLDTLRLIEADVWGQGFAPPVFCDEWHVKSQRLVKDKHLRLLLERDGVTIEAMLFNRADPLPVRATLAYRAGINTWNGQSVPRLLIEHVA